MPSTIPHLGRSSSSLGMTAGSWNPRQTPGPIRNCHGCTRPCVPGVRSAPMGIVTLTNIVLQPGEQRNWICTGASLPLPAACKAPPENLWRGSAPLLAAELVQRASGGGVLHGANGDYIFGESNQEATCSRRRATADLNCIRMATDSGVADSQPTNLDFTLEPIKWIPCCPRRFQPRPTPQRHEQLRRTAAGMFRNLRETMIEAWYASTPSLVFRGFSITRPWKMICISEKNRPPPTYISELSSPNRKWTGMISWRVTCWSGRWCHVAVVIDRGRRDFTTTARWWVRAGRLQFH